MTRHSINPGAQFSLLFFAFLCTCTWNCGKCEESDSTIRKFFRALTDWIDPDKIPSVEVKVGTSGVSVSTGPSREDIYWVVGVSVGAGFALLALLIISILLCRYAGKRRTRQIELSMWNATRMRQIQSPIEVPGSFMILNPTLGTPLRPSNIACPNNSNANSPGYVNAGYGQWVKK